MSKSDSSGKGQALDRDDLRARVDFALELAGWVDQMPQPPTTLAKTMNDIILETCAKLAKIATCYHLQEALDGATDGQVMSEDPAADAYFEQIKQDAIAGMESAGCKSL
jgi:hypothetical protein